MYELGDVADATETLRELEPLAKKLGHHAAQMLCVRTRAWSEFSKECDLARLEEWFKRDLEITRTAELPWIATSFSQLALVEFLRGDWGAALQHAEQSNAAEFPNAFEGWGAGTLFRQKAYAGDRAGALALLAQKRAKLPHLGLPNTVATWGFLMLAIEGFTMLGEWDQAAALYPLARQAVETGVKCLAEISRFAQTAAGLAAAAGRNWEAAEKHFAVAMHEAVEFPHRLEQVEICRFHGQMLIERGSSGDGEKARAMLGTAIQGYTKMGMLRHGEIARTLLKRADSMN
jgi:tetratricopeptide (TPR) repeat protein